MDTYSPAAGMLVAGSARVTTGAAPVVVADSVADDGDTLTTIAGVTEPPPLPQPPQPAASTATARPAAQLLKFSMFSSLDFEAVVLFCF